MTGDPAGAGRPIPSCGLDREGLRSQRDRYSALGAHAVRSSRTPGLLTVGFDPDVDERLLAEAIAVERACCPFFELSYDSGSRELTISVSDPSDEAALGALQDALALRRARLT